ncbi:MAG TPA: DUF4097 family beta strand repeat-containing protein [Thermomonas sp.]|jgi:DUF4097 and DUF4098 domain-containing protein YvlB|uniref:DUF4097 family beta strand repeat-containing protein n=1 Tax=Thermomonas sp. TaxID=1971895 RepID=UPI002B617B00|nr:DUF4097 family beta strand repeat-containing protein [Thermomonas sp.]
MRTLLIRCTLALACLAALPALAGTPIDQTRPLDARGRIEIENLKGRVEVRAWDRQEVKVTGTLGDGVEKFSMDGDRRNLRIEVKYPSRSGRTEPTVLIVQVPILADLEIETVSADIDVHGIASRELSLESVSGDIAANGAPREARIESVSGDVRLTLNSPDVSVDNVSGELVLQGRLNGEVSLETVSGNVRMDGLGERVRSLSAGTVSGDMDLKTALADGGEIRLESVSGDLLLRLPRDLSAEVSGESFSGDLSAPDARIQREEFGPGSSFEARYGAGKGEVRMETFSGDATLRLL